MPCARVSSFSRDGFPNRTLAERGSHPSCSFIARWYCSSSSISCVWVPERNVRESLDHRLMRRLALDGSQNFCHGGRYRAPPLLFLLQPLPAFRRQLVEAGAASGFRHAPLGFQPPVLGHAMKSGIEGAFLDAPDVVRGLLNTGRNGVPVVGAPPEDFKNQNFERTLQMIGFWH